MIYSTHLLRHLRGVIGLNIHRARADKKMPLGKLAEATGLSRDLLDQYEIGKNEIPLHHLLKIACGLDLPISTLLH